MSSISVVDAGVARVIIANPPVNALSLSKGVIAALIDAMESALRDPDISYITIEGAAGRFCAGADIADFDLPKGRIEETRRLMAIIASATKPTIALVAGEALGGGLELALACRARIGTADAKLGLPEIHLGLLPGSGGTQRAPKLIGAGRALDLMLGGKPISGAIAHEIGLLDALAPNADDLRLEAERLVRTGMPPRIQQSTVSADAEIDQMAQKHARLVARSTAALHIVSCVAAAYRLPLEEGLRHEAERFADLMQSSQSRALRYAFFSERAVARFPGMQGERPREIRTVGVVGAGTMGLGIAAGALGAGFSVILVDANKELAARAATGIADLFEKDVSKGRISEAEAQQRLERLVLGDGLKAFGDVDLVIEAVFEDMDIKCRLLAELDDVVRHDCILASNTSTLDLNRLAAATADPSRVVGLHFFSPAHIMRLLEIVRGSATARDVLATALAFAKQMQKVPVVAGVCDGFIGNRMFEECLRQAYFLLEEGALPAQVDGALERFGMAMGPLKVMDLAGQDIGYKIRQRRMAEHPDRPYSRIPDLLCESGRLGQKTSAGFYDYADGRKPVRSEAVEALIRNVSRERGIDRREISDEEIVERCIFALVNEGAKIVDEGIAVRPLDVDMVWINGYGFPRDHGGPMFYADEIGLDHVLTRIRTFELGAEGWAWKPSSLLARLADGGGSLAALNGVGGGRH